MLRILSVVVISMLLSGCAEIPMRDGELVIGKDTTVGAEDLGVASINRQF